MKFMKPSTDALISYLGRTTFRNQGRLFGIRLADRRFHLLVIGKTGSGKSWLFRTMAFQDVQANIGFALLDPHGDLATRVRDFVAGDSRLIYLNVPDPGMPWRFNPLFGVPQEKHPLAVAGLVETFKKSWAGDWGPRLEHLLRNVMFTLLETPGSTFADIPALLSDKDYRRDVVSDLENPAVREFWELEFSRYSPAFRAVVVAPLQNKIGALLTDPTLRRILTGEGASLDLRQIMDQGKILIVNLDKGRLGEGPAALLGSFLLSHMSLAGLSRSEIPEAKRRDFFIYADEFHTFATESFATMLSELRKYRVGLVLAHQYLAQVDPVIRDAVFGNVGTMVSFRLGAADAAYIAHEFAPTFEPEDLIRLPNYNIYLRLMIDGDMSSPFSAQTLGSLHDIPGFKGHPNAN